MTDIGWFERPVLSDRNYFSSEAFTRLMNQQPLKKYEDYMINLNELCESGKKSPLGTPLYRFASLLHRNYDSGIHQTLLRIDFTTQPAATAAMSVTPMQEAPVVDISARKDTLIFIDYSNISAGLQASENAHCINPGGLASFLEAGRFCKQKQIVGSFPSAAHPIWKSWEKLGYRCRITGAGKGKTITHRNTFNQSRETVYFSTWTCFC